MLVIWSSWDVHYWPEVDFDFVYAEEVRHDILSGLGGGYLALVFSCWEENMIS